MRLVFRSVVVLCALLALACQGAKGDKGDTGPAGPTGQQGPTGTFSGTTSSPVTFSGGATISGGTTITGAVAVNGQDLFAAAMQGLYPGVLGYGVGGTGHVVCGAPASVDVSTTVSNANVTYGELIYTSAGQFNLTQSNGAGSTTCTNVCLGPITFFLTSPSAQTIVIQGYFDDGPSKIYVDGTAQATIAGTVNQGINVPAGAFALSMVACSNNGFSVGFSITNPWVTTYGLSIDIDRTFHRNGK